MDDDVLLASAFRKLVAHGGGTWFETWDQGDGTAAVQVDGGAQITHEERLAIERAALPD